jgi:tryptophan 2-monooxygenase
MPFVPNLTPEDLVKRVGVDPTPCAWPFLDEMYDYLQLIGTGDPRQNPIGKLPPNAQGLTVAIVGAGPAGMVAAFELLKLGLKPAIIEASGRIGGRNWSEPFSSGGFAEMGAMRVPSQNKVFWQYATGFGLTKLPFPDPGVVPTLLYYENQSYWWNKDGNPTKPDPPGPFKTINDAFNAWAGKLITPFWDNWSDPATVQQLWQSAINTYKDTSFYEAVVDGIKWSTEQQNQFGALGVGSGGFGPLYGVGFLELLRILINQFEVDQSMVEEGIGAVTENLYTQKVQSPNGLVSLEDQQCLNLNTTVASMVFDQSANQVILTLDTDMGQQQQTFDAVIVATTTRAMEVMGLTILPDSNPSSVIDEEVKTGIRNLHLMESSKLFVKTPTKFWGNGIPQDIQTDELPRQVYCLDYPDLTEGVVLMSYTWGDDSAKLLALSPEGRYYTFKNMLEVICQPFADALPDLADAELLSVDWEATPEYYGAFKLQYPGQDSYAQAAFFQFQSASDASTDRGVYLAGDSVSWAGGWTEGALHTGLNAACAVIQRFGGQFFANTTPLDINPQLYTYSDPG